MLKLKFQVLIMRAILKTDEKNSNKLYLFLHNRIYNTRRSSSIKAHLYCDIITNIVLKINCETISCKYNN